MRLWFSSPCVIDHTGFSEPALLPVDLGGGMACIQAASIWGEGGISALCWQGGDMTAKGSDDLSAGKHHGFSIRRDGRAATSSGDPLDVGLLPAFLDTAK